MRREVSDTGRHSDFAAAEEIRHNKMTFTVLEKRQQGYQIPFTRRPIAIIQGFGGPYSHKRISPNIDLTYSIDFLLPLLTDVIASRQGTVARIYDRSRWFDERAELGSFPLIAGNLVELLHSDGSSARYEHLERGSASGLGIKPGDWIEQGQLIGKTGLSGWIGPYPHLHFMVYESEALGSAISARRVQSKPIGFADYDGPLWHKDLWKQ